MTIAELIEKVEKATEGSRELDFALRLLMTDAPAGVATNYVRIGDDSASTPTYTSSTDAALSLVELKVGANWYSILLDAICAFGASGTLGPEHLARYVILALLRALNSMEQPS